MNKRIALAATLLAGIVGATSIVPAMAENHTAADKAEVQAMADVKLTVAEASAAAEAQFGGKVVEVSLDVVNGKPIYDVSLIGTDGTETEAMVDAVTGAVAAAPAEQADDETGGQTEDGEQGGENGEANEGAEGNEAQ
ncbi:PepSY domain-containing protein [Devosia salina]|uniref:PepSY domain-containing protein n=1 Tax=Devosia salina TaxID=2860336 RepID=A0ABX8WA58_9HYPH|nr:PepSY domain-containing protein [Devosia salina]QYO75581.1 PepSY domain-containing protein [Devosia salina]